MVKKFFIFSAKRFTVCILMSLLFFADISAQGYQPRLQDPYPSKYRQSSSHKQTKRNAYPSRYRQSSTQNQRTQDAYPSRYRQSSSQNQRTQDAYSSRYRQSSSQYQRNGSTRREYSNPFMKQDKNNNSSKTEKTSKRSAKSEEDAKRISSSISDNKSADDVELIVTGEGKTKDDATKTALRSAIEQAFGTFVSSNTNILNDELVKDEIVTVSSGNVKKYSILSENEANGKWNVTVQTTISIGGLVKYVQSKGAEAELAGAAFAMNVRMKELNRKNQETALRNLETQLKELFSKSFDYEVVVGEPREGNGHHPYYVPIVVTVKANKNAEACYQLYHKTLSALSSYSRGEANASKIIVFKNRTAPIKEYYLYANPNYALVYLESILLDCICNFTLSDGVNEYVGNYDYNHNSPRVHLLDSKTKKVFETADRFIKKKGPLLISKKYDYTDDDVPFLPIIANSNYAGNTIAQFKFELGYGLEQISKISSFKIRPNNSKE